MEFVSWDDDIPYIVEHKIPWFQSPPTRNLCSCFCISILAAKQKHPNQIPESPPAEAPNKYKSKRMSNVAQMLKIATEPLLSKCGPDDVSWIG
jgi:hypothetical protein